jgi:hypothetical protein
LVLTLALPLKIFTKSEASHSQTSVGEFTTRINTKYTYTQLLSHFVRYITMNVFESRQLDRIIGLKWDEVTGYWRKLNNEELHNLYSSPNIITIFNQREWYDGEQGIHGRNEKFWSENLKGPDHLKAYMGE